jgi:U6 snRNA-associated Sm-like protein LSm6
MENGTQGEGKDPSSFLSEIIGNAVTVKLNSGVIYKGKFSLSFSFDGITAATDSRYMRLTWWLGQASYSPSMAT